MNLSAMNRAGRSSAGLQERVFTVSQARRALLFLQPVLTDAVNAYQQAQDARNGLDSEITGDRRTALTECRDAAIARLNRTIDECHAVGVCMVNIAEGSLAMKVRHGAASMCLLWRLGEPVETAWLEIETAGAMAGSSRGAAGLSLADIPHEADVVSS